MVWAQNKPTQAISN